MLSHAPSLARLLSSVALAAGVAMLLCCSATAAPRQASLIFSGGHLTDPRDGGRLVVLIAAGLGVQPDVFRRAFSGVTPARGGPPTRGQAQANKQALMRVLGPLGISNDRLDEVSNYYRYRPGSGELWTHREAAGYAIVDGEKVRKIVITDAGAGYSSVPAVSVEELPQVKLTATLHFDRDLARNGSIKSVVASDAVAIQAGGAKTATLTPAAADAVLERFVGDWRTHVEIRRLSSSPRTMETRGKAHGKRTLGGRYVEFRSESNDRSESDLQIMTYNTKTKRFEQWVFDSDGYQHHAEGTWDAGRQVLHWTGRTDNGTFVIADHWESPDRLEWTLTRTDRAGRTIQTIRGVVERGR